MGHHWKHGWIPLDGAALAEKEHHRRTPEKPKGTSVAGRAMIPHEGGSARRVAETAIDSLRNPDGTMGSTHPKTRKAVERAQKRLDKMRKG